MEASFPSSHARGLTVRLHFAAMKELILFAAAALGALKAAHQKHRYACRDQHGQNAHVHREPMR